MNEMFVGVEEQQRIEQFFVADDVILSNGLPDAIAEQARQERIAALSIVSPALSSDGRRGALVVLVTTRPRQ